MAFEIFFTIFGEGIYNLVPSFKSIRLFKKNSFLNERFVRTYYLFKNGYNSILYDKCMRGAGDTVRSIIISANSRLAFL